jgi:hypothetical protein
MEISNIRMKNRTTNSGLTTLIIFILLSLGIGGCEIFTIGGDYPEPEKKTELVRTTPEGTALLFWNEIQRDNFRAAARIYRLGQGDGLLSDNPKPGYAAKRFAMVTRLQMLAEEMRSSPHRKLDVLVTGDAQSTIRLITERNDTLDLRLVERRDWWYIEKIDYKPFRI